MPSYQYYCPLCNLGVTVTKSIHSTEGEQCDNCKVPLIKVYSAPGLNFKGGGWAHKENQKLTTCDPSMNVLGFSLQLNREQKLDKNDPSTNVRKGKVKL